MATSVYQLNKGINKPVVFKGLKAQYIWYLAGGLIMLLFIFAIMYLCEVNTYVALAIILFFGVLLIGYVYKLSHKYGQYGMMKKIARRSIPDAIKIYSRKEFTGLKI